MLQDEGVPRGLDRYSVLCVDMVVFLFRLEPFATILTDND